MSLRQALALALGLSLAGPLPLAAQGLPFAADDVGMTSAIDEARSHLDLVLSQLVDAKHSIHPALNLKVRVPVQHIDVQEELIWVDGLALDETAFTGTLASQPAYFKGHQLGDPIRFERADIADWSVLDTTGRMYGHFTTRVLLPTLDPDQAAQVRDLLMPEALPDAWR